MRGSEERREKEERIGELGGNINNRTTLEAARSFPIVRNKYKQVCAPLLLLL